MVASYRKAMVAQRKLILNTSGGNGVGNVNISTNTLSNMNILPITQNNLSIIDEEGSSNNNSTSRKKTGRPVGRPKSKDKQ